MALATAVKAPRIPEMTLSSRLLARLWMVVPVCACGYLAWATHVRAQRIDHVSGLEGRANPADVPDARSPTGYANGQRELIIPERIEDSFQWIEQTQQMFAQGELRVRHVDYENPPSGHPVTWASPYRWWLGLVAWADHAVSGRPIGISVERAAVYADPLLLALLVLGAAAFSAWRFGAFAAALLSVGLVGLFPFASLFLPGMPGQAGLATVCALGSLLALLSGVFAEKNARLWFAAAGIAGGLGLWISVPTLVPFVLGTCAGALLAALIPAAGAAPWRSWSLAGGATVLAAYLLEYFPSHMTSWRLATVHPLYGLAWIGAGELLARAVAWIRGARTPWTLRDVLVVVFSAAVVVAVPFVMWKTAGPGFLVRGLEWARLTELPNSPVAAGSAAWLLRDGLTLTAAAALLPLATLAPAVWLMLRSDTRPQVRAAIAVAAGPAVVALGYALRQLSWWGVFDAALLAVVVAAAAGKWKPAGARSRWLLAAAVLAFTVPGIARMLPERGAGRATALTPAESEQLVERHLAHWLAKRTGEPGVVVFAPPNETTTLSFFGGLRGIGTLAPDNSVGLGNSLAIAGARTMEEAQDDLQARGVRYIVVPSWDPFFSEFGRRYLVKEMSDRTSFVVNQLLRWNLPPWLKPVPYQMPVGGGFGGQSVVVFEVVDPQTPAAAAGRLAEYLVETGDLGAAATEAAKLRRFPGDVGALAAQAQVESALGETDSAAQTLASLLARLSSGGDRYLAWDRRVSLAVVLARGERFGLAREQLRRCVAEANEARLRSLSTASLYDLLVLVHSFKLEFTDPGLRDLALDLLPGDLRNRL
jgi:hypothetical protein